ncbi:MAG: GH3 auxin-responsive promoter family protein [Rikenellaceae bacterium]
MPIITKFINITSSVRRKKIDFFRRNPIQVQQQQFEWLVKRLKNTSFGSEHGISSNCSLSDFQNKIEVQDYSGFQPYIERIQRGEKNVLWDSKVRWFAKSSGTTDSKSKYIPVTNQMLMGSHKQGPKDTVYTYFVNNPNSRMLYGDSLTLGGSHKIEREGSNILSGDLSAILIENTPKWINFKRCPKKSIALLADFDEKVEKIYKVAKNKNITSFAGVPSWNLVMMNKFLEYSGKNNLLEVWPNLEIFLHGGMNFNPYRELYKQLIPTDNMHYVETYNASEGFFAFADDFARDDMLLALDYGTFYEFLAMNDLASPEKAVPLEGVKCGVNYAIIISASNGLWRYMIGDTVTFTSTNPYRIKITGRTKHFVNAFGEEIIVDNAERAIRHACDMTNSEIREYSAAPIYMQGREKGSHEWVIEFAKSPNNLDAFTDAMDKKLQEINSDYEAKRKNNTTLLRPTVTVVSKGTFNRWILSTRGKIGGQNKIPRLSNQRDTIEQLIKCDK